MVDFTQQTLGVEVIEEPVDVGIFGQQHQAKGIPVQPGSRVKRAGLAGPAIVPQHAVGQGPSHPVAGGMDQDASRFVHHQKVLILVADLQGHVLRRVFGLRVIQQCSNPVPRRNLGVGPGRLPVDQKGLLPFQPVHKAGGHVQLPL